MSATEDIEEKFDGACQNHKISSLQKVVHCRHSEIQRKCRAPLISSHEVWCLAKRFGNLIQGILRFDEQIRLFIQIFSTVESTNYK